MLGAGILVAVVVLPTASAADSVAGPVLTVTVIALFTFRKTDGAAATSPPLRLLSSSQLQRALHWPLALLHQLPSPPD